MLLRSWSEQEENQMRVSVSTGTITVFILCFLNNPRLSYLESSPPPPTAVVTPPRRQTQVLQASASVPTTEASSWKGPVSM